MAADEHPPSLVVVDADPGVATGLTLELQYGFGREYRLIATLSARSGLDILKRLGAAGELVALVIAGLQLPDMPGPEFLSHARRLQPLAKRVALVRLQELVSSEALHRAMALGQADSWLQKPWAPHDQHLHAEVADLLDEWTEDSGRQQSPEFHLVGQRREPRSMELHDRLERIGARYRFTEAESAEGRELLRRIGRGGDRLPVAILADGPVLVQPTWTELSAAVGVRLQPYTRPYDVAVVGAEVDAARAQPAALPATSAG